MRTCIGFLALLCSAHAQPTNLRFPDFNGDGKSDIFLKSTDGLTWTGLSDGSGIFQSFIPGSGRLQSVVPSIYYQSGVVLYGDFNGDHKTDILPLYDRAQFPDNSTLAGISTLDGTFEFAHLPRPELPANAPPYDVRQVADLNGDGKSDVLLYQRVLGNAAIGISKGNSFAFTSSYFGPGYDMLRLADFNGDGIPDLLLYDRDTPRASIGIGDGKGNFRLSALWLSPGYDIIETGDLNGDGVADLVLYNSQTGTAHIGIADGHGGFTFTYHLWRQGCSRIRMADVDGDGKPDLLLYSQSGGQADLGYGDGKGGFEFKNLLWGSGYDTVEVADFNGDGKADFLLYNSQTGTAYTAVSDGSPNVFAYHYHLWMPGLTVGTVQDSGQILAGPPILFEFKSALEPPDTPAFVAAIVDPGQVQIARNMIRNAFGATFLFGQVIAYPSTYNPTWSYHLRPETIGLPDLLSGAGTCQPVLGKPGALPFATTQTLSTFLCVVIYGQQIREIGPLRP